MEVIPLRDTFPLRVDFRPFPSLSKSALFSYKMKDLSKIKWFEGEMLTFPREGKFPSSYFLPHLGPQATKHKPVPNLLVDTGTNIAPTFCEGFLVKRTLTTSGILLKRIAVLIVAAPLHMCVADHDRQTRDLPGGTGIPREQLLTSGSQLPNVNR